VSCDELLRRLAEYEDGVLPSEVCEALQKHVTECPPCAELQRDLAALARLCKCTQPARLPEDLRARLRAHLERRP
jgi:anti-sigma factor (TIGR02949 family)